MRKLLTAVATMAAAILLVPAASVAQAPTGDYASGLGFWHADDPDDPGPGSVGFQVTQFIPADDEFDYRRESDGRGFHAEPVCVAVHGHEAWMTLAVQRSNLPGVTLPAVFVAYAADNGDGKDDEFDLDPPPPQGTPFDERCGTLTVVFDPDPIDGDITVADSGVFGSPF